MTRGSSRAWFLWCQWFYLQKVRRSLGTANDGAGQAGRVMADLYRCELQSSLYGYRIRGHVLQRWITAEAAQVEVSIWGTVDFARLGYDRTVKEGGG